MFNLPLISSCLQICMCSVKKKKKSLCISLTKIHGSFHRKRWRWTVINAFPGLIFRFTRKWLGLIQPNKRQVITVIPIQKECQLYIMNQVTMFKLISFGSKKFHTTLLFYWYLRVIFTHLNDHSLSHNCKLETVLQAKALTTHAANALPALARPQRRLPWGARGHTAARKAEERRLSFIPVHSSPPLG